MGEAKLRWKKQVIISVMNTKGGVGKSTIVTHLAGWLKRQKGLNVKLCDCDPQRSSSRWMKLADPELEVHEVTTNGDLTSIIMKKKPDDVLIVDGKAGDANISRGIFLDSDYVLIPSSPSMLDFEVTVKQCRTIKQIRMITASEKPFAVVAFNRIARDKQSTDIIETKEVENIPVLPNFLRFRAPYADAAGKGKLVWDLPFFTLPAQREMTHFLEMVWRYRDGVPAAPPRPEDAKNPFLDSSSEDFNHQNFH